jgi:predicted nucleic acid-binding protein
VRFEQRILLVDRAVADEWGRMVARGAQRGRPIGAMDALVASTAQVHGLTLVTRNAKDFEGAVKSVLNPWT